MSGLPTTRLRRPLLPEPDSELAVEEVRLLWSFVHGDIMDSTARSVLRSNWGLCDRHSWGHALVEIELWEHGAGARGGHQPFDVGVLYADLAEEMERVLHRRHRPRRLAKALGASGYCLLCHELTGPQQAGSLGYAGFDSAALADEANSMLHLRDWVVQSQPVWAPSSCPSCGAGGAVMCRRHLDPAGRQDVDRAARLLSGNLPLLRLLLSSMTAAGPVSTPEADASWVILLGWFHGWDLPLRLA